jgi:hypothetical protein
MKNFFQACFFSSFILVLFADIGDEFIQQGKGPNELTTLEYLSIVTPFLPSHPNVLEAGAHSGEDTVLMADVWKNGHVFAFEPVQKFFDHLKKRVENHQCTNISAFPIGLFSTSGNQPFYYSQTCGGASSFLPDNGLVDYDDIQMILPCENLGQPPLASNRLIYSKTPHKSIG